MSIFYSKSSLREKAKLRTACEALHIWFRVTFLTHSPSGSLWPNGQVCSHLRDLSLNSSFCNIHHPNYDCLAISSPSNLCSDFISLMKSTMNFFFNIATGPALLISLVLFYFLLYSIALITF